MSNFEDAVIQRIKQLEREVERLQKWERPDKTGWIPVSDTWTYVSATSFKITGKDVCYRFPKGTKIKLVQSGSTKYFYVIATAYSTDTTVTITGGSDYTLANATISGQAYSYAAAPQGFPLGTSTFVPLITPATSTSWDGDYYSTIGKTLINLSSVFGLPANIKAIYARIFCRDSASGSTNYLSFNLSGTSAANAGNAMSAIPSGLPNNYYVNVNGICPCNADGNVYYSIAASGTNTMQCYIEIYGYWI